MFDPTYDATARDLLALANVRPEQFCEIEAKSDSQRNFANDMKIKALVVIWEALKEEKKTVAYASALVQAIRDKKDARFWLNDQNAWSFPRSAIAPLREGIKKNLEISK